VDRRTVNDLKPLEVVVLAVFPSLALVGIVGFLSWYWLRRREIDLAALGTDEQAARLLGESLGQAFVSAEVIEEVMTAFARMNSPTKRTLAMSIAGLIAQHSTDHWETLGPKILGVVRGLSAPLAGNPPAGSGGPPPLDKGDSTFFDPRRAN